MSAKKEYSLQAVEWRTSTLIAVLPECYARAVISASQIKSNWSALLD